MKFFTSDLINSMSEENDKQWEKALIEYNNHFSKFKMHFPKTFFKVYEKKDYYHFHDGKVIEISVKRKNSKKVPFVVLLITFQVGHEIYQLIYHSVANLEFRSNFQTEKLVFVKHNVDEFDVWLYDEFDQVNENTFSHEILFLSESILKIHFKKISIKKIK